MIFLLHYYYWNIVFNCDVTCKFSIAEIYQTEKYHFILAQWNTYVLIPWYFLCPKPGNCLQTGRQNNYIAHFLLFLSLRNNWQPKFWKPLFYIFFQFLKIVSRKKKHMVPVFTSWLKAEQSGKVSHCVL